jgi:hypothetical protein
MKIWVHGVQAKDVFIPLFDGHYIAMFTTIYSAVLG